MSQRQELDHFQAKLGLRNQIQIAETLGVATATVCDWHREHIPMPKRASLHMQALIKVKELEEKLAKVKARGIKV